MITVVGVQFKGAGKVYWFDPGELVPGDGQGVIVETARGVEYGVVSGEVRQVEESAVVQPLRQVVRVADADDERRMEDNKTKEKDAFGIAQEKILKHGLEMKLVDVEYAFDGSRIHFFFTANGRVDFRELVRDLAAQFRTRIELRQIGVRDEAKMLGGLGPCGRPICCRQFLPDFQPVSIRMAKEQNLSLNPAKISGQCGRLMCCLKYEQDTYECIRRSVPKVGREVVTPDGLGIVMDINVLKERMRVRLHMADGSFDVREYPFCDVCRKGNASNGQQGDDSDDLPDVAEEKAPSAEAERPAREERPVRAPRAPHPNANSRPHRGGAPRPDKPRENNPRESKPPHEGGRTDGELAGTQDAERRGRPPRRRPNGPPKRPREPQE